MKLLLKICAGLCLVYVLFWGSLAAYFSYAERHKELLENNLTQVFGRAVNIDEVQTVWHGISPRIQINGFRVASDVAGESALAFDSMSAELSPLSLLSLWPRFTELAVERPFVEIASLEGNKLQIAGIELKSNRGRGMNLKRVITWLINHENAAWLDGQIVWRRLDGELQRYKNISFVYQRKRQARNVAMVGTTPKGSLAFKAEANGNPFEQENWDASLEVLGNQGERLLSPEDLSLNVQEGHGELNLKTLDVERIRDFLQLTSLTDSTAWLLDANLDGRLHDVQFKFSGPLLKIDDWSLAAAASDISFKSVGRVPAMNNLRGQLKASASGGQFLFFTKKALFEWPRWFDSNYPIERASGEFAWRFEPSGEAIVSLTDGEIVDKNVRIFNINANGKLDSRARRVSSFGQLFKVESIAKLDYKDGQVVEPSDAQGTGVSPIVVDASAEFEMMDFAAVASYLPNNPKIDKFRAWASNAFLAGNASNGKASYRGELSGNAMQVGKANLEASADFSEVEIDYGYLRNWPAVNSAHGTATIKNDLLHIAPEKINLGPHALSNAELSIVSLFNRDRYIELHGDVTMGLPDGVEFLFQGPLIAPDKIPEKLPVQADKGTVEINAQVTIPLRRIRDTKVVGRAIVKDGRAFLPSNIPLDKINATVQFTEQSVTSDDIAALFLGGQTNAQLVTTEQAQPPIMQLSASGVAEVDKLQPVLGEHLLTWFDGQAAWQGSLLIDGPRLEIESKSELVGIGINAPYPLKKEASQSRGLSISMVTGGKGVQKQLTVDYGGLMQTQMRSFNQAQLNKKGDGKPGTLFNQMLVSVGANAIADAAIIARDDAFKEGVSFDLQQDDVDLDEWLTAIIDLANYVPKKKIDNTVFLDAMRSVRIRAQDPFLLGRKFGALDLAAISVDGQYWIGTLNGENVQGTMKLQPRAEIGEYAFDLSNLNLVAKPELEGPPAAINYSLNPDAYPHVSLDIDRFRLAGRNLGSLKVSGKPVGEKWVLTEFDMSHNGIKTMASGAWMNNKESGSITSFDFDTKIDEAEGVLDDMAFDGFIKKGKGAIIGNINWLGAPHEFDYSRLNGDFDIQLADGELVKVAPGGGKLLGLLNFNAIARRITLDFRDVFASGLSFDRMRYTGLFSEGEAIMRDAFIFTPAVFVRMEGKLDLDKELIDMEIHMSPELGGNLTLLSALANPAAGAVVFLTQRIFKDEMRKSSFKSFRALGTWEDFEMVEFNAQKKNSQQPDSDPEGADSEKHDAAQALEINPVAPNPTP